MVLLFTFPPRFMHAGNVNYTDMTWGASANLVGDCGGCTPNFVGKFTKRLIFSTNLGLHPLPPS